MVEHFEGTSSVKVRVEHGWLVTVVALVAVTSLLTATVVEGKEYTPSSSPEDLRSYVDRINKKASPTVEELINQANASEWLRDFRSASSSMGRVIKAQPDDAEAYAYRGTLFKQARDLPNALADFDKAEALGYSNPGLYGERMLVKLNLRDYVGASADADAYLLRAPDKPNAYFVKGRAECEAGRAKSGIAFFSKAIELNPNTSFYYEARAQAYEKLGRKKDAQLDLEKAAALRKQ